MQLQHKDALDTFKIFPYIAWGLTLVFAIFVYNIARELQVVAEDLQEQTQYLQEKINQPVHEIEEFDAKKNPATR